DWGLAGACPFHDDSKRAGGSKTAYLCYTSTPLIRGGGGGVATSHPEIGTPFSRKTRQSSMVQNRKRGKVRNGATNAIYHEMQVQICIVFECNLLAPSSEIPQYIGPEFLAKDLAD
ncbi:hypothetical protein STEG23_004198, partial [Scotinomys teguina]